MKQHRNSVLGGWGECGVNLAPSLSFPPTLSPSQLPFCQVGAENCNFSPNPSKQRVSPSSTLTLQISCAHSSKSHLLSLKFRKGCRYLPSTPCKECLSWAWSPGFATSNNNVKKYICKIKTWLIKSNLQLYSPFLPESTKCFLINSAPSLQSTNYFLEMVWALWENASILFTFMIPVTVKPLLSDFLWISKLLLTGPLHIAPSVDSWCL